MKSSSEYYSLLRIPTWTFTFTCFSFAKPWISSSVPNSSKSSVGVLSTDIFSAQVLIDGTKRKIVYLFPNSRRRGGGPSCYFKKQLMLVLSLSMSIPRFRDHSFSSRFNPGSTNLDLKYKFLSKFNQFVGNSQSNSSF